MTPSLHPKSPFKEFNLPLANGHHITGLSHIPTHLSTRSSRPLLIAIHGGTCTAHNYDISPTLSASLTSTALGIPFIAINRPCYHTSSSFLPFPTTNGEDKKHSFFAETARWLHEFILPALWETFGVPNGCTGMVTTSHSMAVGPSLIATARYCTESTSARYQLMGIIISGAGTEWRNQPDLEQRVLDAQTGNLTYPFHVKKNLMLSEEEFACYDPSVVPLLKEQDVSMPLEEVKSLGGDGVMVVKAAAQITLPVMYALGEHDWLWHSSRKNVEAYGQLFEKCPSFTGSVGLGAPHAIEWSRVADGWYVRCFGWAEEVCSQRTAKL